MSFLNILRDKYLEEDPGADPAPGGGGDPADPPAGDPAPWHAGVSDAAAALIGERKWDSLDAMAESYQNLESLKGVPEAELLRLPKDGDVEGMKAIMQKLGTPEAADKYQLQFGDNADAKFTEWARGAFHKIGLPAGMAEQLSAEWAGYTAARTEEMTNDANVNFDAQEADLKKEWGAGYDKNVAQAKAAIQEFGVDQDMVDKLESALGFDGVMKLLQNVGSRLGEDTFEGGGGSQDFSGAMTPAQAQQKYNDAMMDSNFTEALMNRNNPGHAAAIERKTQLMSYMHPEAQ